MQGNCGFERSHPPMCESPLENQVAIIFSRKPKCGCAENGSNRTRKRKRQEAGRFLHRAGLAGKTASLEAPRVIKRTAACASHASRLVKCDVPKLRPDPCGSGAASAFPSVPPTKSGEIAHFKSDRPTRWRSYGGGLVTNPWEGLRTRLALACGFSSSRRPRQCALCTSHSVVARDFARCTTSEQVKIGACLCRSCGVCGFPVEMKGKIGKNSPVAPE